MRADVARAAVEDDARDAEELGEVLADHLGAHEIARERLAELQEPPELAVLGLLLLEAMDLLAKARVLVGEPLVVGLHVDEIDVALPEVRDAAREARCRELDRAR